MTRRGDEHRAAWDLLAREKHGVLSTAHALHGGWPFGSVTPYALTAEGDPVFYLSEIAEHTRNLRADSRASLLVQDPAARADPQAGARVTLLGRASVPPEPQAQFQTMKPALEAYLARFPEAGDYTRAHGFAPFVLRVERVRWILGFGVMGWLEREEWASLAASTDPLAPHARSMLEHMNRDHADAVLELAAHFAGLRGSSAAMTGIDSRGFEVEVAGQEGRTRTRIEFPAPASTPEEARRAIVAMLAQARKARKPDLA